MTSWTNSMMRPHDLVFRVSVGRKSCERQIHWNRSGIPIPWQRRGWNRNLVQYRKLKNVLFFVPLSLWFKIHSQGWLFYSYLSNLAPATLFTRRVFGQGETGFYVANTKNCIFWGWDLGVQKFLFQNSTAFVNAHSVELFHGQQLDQWLHGVLDEVRVGENILGLAGGSWVRACLIDSLESYSTCFSRVFLILF